MRPLVRWMGSKSRMVPWYVEHMPKHRLYVETHGGSATVLLNKPRSAVEVLNDRDEELFNLYKIVRHPRQGMDLVDALMCTPFSETEFLLAEHNEPTDDLVERARRLIVRQGMAFANDTRVDGSIRSFRDYTEDTNRDTSRDWYNYLVALAGIVERLQKVTMHGMDAVDLIEKYDADDVLFFVDPPYLNRKIARFRYRHEYGVEDHRRLLDCLLAAEGMALVCGYASELYDDALRGWRRVTKVARDQARGKTQEVLWLSPRTAAALDESRRQPDLFEALG